MLNHAPTPDLTRHERRITVDGIPPFTMRYSAAAIYAMEDAAPILASHTANKVATTPVAQCSVGGISTANVVPLR